MGLVTPTGVAGGRVAVLQCRVEAVYVVTGGGDREGCGDSGSAEIPQRREALPAPVRGGVAEEVNDDCRKFVHAVGGKQEAGESREDQVPKEAHLGWAVSHAFGRVNAKS